MANFCGKCGSRLDSNTGLCPNCDSKRISAIQRQSKKRKTLLVWFALSVTVTAVLLIMLFVLGMFTSSDEILPVPVTNPALQSDSTIDEIPPAPVTNPALQSDFTLEEIPPAPVTDPALQSDFTIDEIPPVPVTRPVLKSDFTMLSEDNKPSKKIPATKVFGSDIDKEMISSIQFLDSQSDAPEDAWDVSEAMDRSVLAWVNDNYDLFIAGEGGVWAPEDASFLFAEYRWMESLDFNNAFFVDNCKTMKGMFYHNQFLSALDLSGWNTTSVENMDNMFLYCSSLKQLDLSSFDTSSVTSMSGMFMRCESMKQLDLHTFDTASVMDMSHMFSQSWELNEINLSGFDTSQVTDISTMFYSCISLEELDISSFDTSSVEKSDGFLLGGVQLMELKIGPGFDISILQASANILPFMAEKGTINGSPWETVLN